MKDYILFVDTETTGIPEDTTTSFKNIDNWPTILQIAWLVYNKDGRIETSFNFSTEEDKKPPIENIKGYIPKVYQPIYKTLDLFLDSLSKCDVIVGHNIEYDVSVILCELYRYGKDTSSLEKMQQFCTMKNCVEICGFDTSRGERYPKLQELYTKLFHQPFENAHDAYCDIKATAECFWIVFNNGLLSVEGFPYLADETTRKQLASDYYLQADRLLYPLCKIEKKVLLQEQPYESFNSTNTPSVLQPIIEPSRETEQSLSSLSYTTSLILGYTTIQEEYEKRKRSFDTPISLLKNAAVFGDSQSMFRIGHILNIELCKDTEAIKWYALAIEHGYTSLDCYYEYATSYYRAHGKNPITKEYLQKWTCLCEDGLSRLPRRHLNNYINLFEKGEFEQEKDIQRAISICNKALVFNRREFGRTVTHPGVRYKLAELLYEIGDLKGFVNQMEKYYNEIKYHSKGTQHIEEVEEYIIRAYYNGLGVKTNLTKAKRFIDDILSFSANNACALYYLGHYYEKGLAGCPKDDEAALSCFEKASKYYPDALLKAGIMYLEGIGCTKSKKKARDYLSQARNRGIDVSPVLMRKAKSWF